MISKAAKRKFLQRELDEFDWMKSLPNEELDKAIAELDPQPDFYTQPFRHQKVMFLIGVYNPSFLFFLDMGGGKTKGVLDIISYLKKLGEAEKALVLVPNVINIESWAKEIEVHAPHLKPVLMNTSTSEREEQLKQEGDVFVLNYQGLLYLACKKNNKNKLTLDKDLIEQNFGDFDTIVMDESQAIKSWQSLTFKVSSRIASMCRNRYALTGTPFGRDPQDLWSQFYAVDRGETLGPTLTLFRECFFHSKKNFWGGYEYKLDKKMEPTLHRFLKHRSIRYADQEFADLPKQVFNRVELSFPSDNRDFYDDLIERIINAKGDYQEIENAFLRMRQICSGFLGHKDEEGEKFEVELSSNPKLDALIELIEEMPEDSKCVIFHDFINSGHIISRELTKRKINHERLYSGTKNPSAALKKFQDNKTCKAFLVNSQSGSAGLNLQVANYCIFFESPVSPIVRSQAEKRVHRTGQKSDRVYYYDLVIKGSVEEKILGFLKEGRDLFKSLVEGKENARDFF